MKTKRMPNEVLKNLRISHHSFRKAAKCSVFCYANTTFAA